MVVAYRNNLHSFYTLVEEMKKDNCYLNNKHIARIEETVFGPIFTASFRGYLNEELYIKSDKDIFTILEHYYEQNKGFKFGNIVYKLKTDHVVKYFGLNNFGEEIQLERKYKSGKHVDHVDPVDLDELVLLEMVSEVPFITRNFDQSLTLYRKTIVNCLKRRLKDDLVRLICLSFCSLMFFASTNGP
jgi:hypothetical protein